MNDNYGEAASEEEYKSGWKPPEPRNWWESLSYRNPDGPQTMRGKLWTSLPGLIILCAIMLWIITQVVK